MVYRWLLLYNCFSRQVSIVVSLVVDRIGYSWDCTCSKWSVCLFIHTVMLSVPAASKVC